MFSFCDVWQKTALKMTFLWKKIEFLLPILQILPKRGFFSYCVFCPWVIFQNVQLLILEFKASYAFIFVQKSYNHIQPILRAKKRDKGIKKANPLQFFVHRWNYLDKITAGEEDNISSPLHLKLLHTCTTSPLLLFFRIQYATLLCLIKNNTQYLIQPIKCFWLRGFYNPSVFDIEFILGIKRIPQDISITCQENLSFICAPRVVTIYILFFCVNRTFALFMET